MPILVFLGLSVLDLGPMYATETRETDRRQTSDSIIANALARGRRHNNVTALPVMKLLDGLVKILSFTPTAVDSSHFNCSWCVTDNRPARSPLVGVVAECFVNFGRILLTSTDEMQLTGKIMTTGNASAMQPSASAMQPIVTVYRFSMRVYIEPYTIVADTDKKLPTAQRIIRSGMVDF